jgi:hypothetical protein
MTATCSPLRHGEPIAAMQRSHGERGWDLTQWPPGLSLDDGLVPRSAAAVRILSGIPRKVPKGSAPCHHRRFDLARDRRCGQSRGSFRIDGHYHCVCSSRSVRGPYFTGVGLGDIWRSLPSRSPDWVGVLVGLGTVGKPARRAGYYDCPIFSQETGRHTHVCTRAFYCEIVPGFGRTCRANRINPAFGVRI